MLKQSAAWSWGFGFLKFDLLQVEVNKFVGIVDKEGMFFEKI